MLAHPNTCQGRRRLLGRLSVRSLVYLVFLPILSLGFGWFVLRLDPRSTNAFCNRDRRGSKRRIMTRRSPITTRRSASSPVPPLPTTAAPTSGSGSRSMTRRSMIITRLSASTLGRLRPSTTGQIAGRLDSAVRVCARLLVFRPGLRLAAKKEYDKAIADYSEVLRLDPRLAAAYVCRGAVWRLKGEYDKALVDFSEAIRFDAKMVFAYSGRAWIWAACPDPRLRDGTKAIESATKACELTNWKDASSLETLAAASAEAGDFVSAVRWQTKVIASLTDLAENQQQRAPLMLYQERKPYHMSDR